MEKETKRIDSHPATDSQIPWTIHVPWPENDVGDPTVLSILGYNLILSDLCEAIRLSPECGMRFNWRRFIQQPSLRLMQIAVHGKGTGTHEAAQALLPERRLKKVSRGDDRIQECGGNRFL